MIVLKLSEGLRLNEVGIRLSVETDYIGQRAAAAGQRIMRMNSFFFGKILKGKETSSVGYYFTISSVTHPNFLS